jgi:hypothetical protein
MDIQFLFQDGLFLQVRGITPGRAAALVPGIMGIISVVTGCLAVARSASPISSRRLMATVALMLGVIGIALSVLHLARAAGPIGSGSGRLGAIVALVLGLTGVFLGGRALARFRRINAGGTTAAASPGERT